MRDIDISIFSGENPEGWILQAERFFRFFRSIDQEKIEIAFNSIAKEALIWCQKEETQQPITSWNNFKERLLIRFGNSQQPSSPNPRSATKTQTMEQTLMEMRQKPEKITVMLELWASNQQRQTTQEIQIQQEKMTDNRSQTHVEAFTTVEEDDTAGVENDLSKEEKFYIDPPTKECFPVSELNEIFGNKSILKESIHHVKVQSQLEKVTAVEEDDSLMLSSVREHVHVLSMQPDLNGKRKLDHRLTWKNYVKKEDDYTSWRYHLLTLFLLPKMVLFDMQFRDFHFEDKVNLKSDHGSLIVDIFDGNDYELESSFSFKVYFD